MKKWICALLCLTLLAASVSAMAEGGEVTVGSFEELKAALEDESVSRITVEGRIAMVDMLTVPTGKTLLIPEGAALTLDGPHFVGEAIFLSLMILEGGEVEVGGSLTTVNNYGVPFAISVVYVNGGRLILLQSASTEGYAAVSYGAGEIVKPASGTPAGFELDWRMEDPDMTVKDLNAMYQNPSIDRVTVAADLTVEAGETLLIPEGKYLEVDGSITVKEGGAVRSEGAFQSWFGFQIVTRDGDTVLLPLENH